MDVGSNRGPSGTHRSRFDGGKCSYGIEAFNYGRSGEGAKSRDAVSDDRGGPTRLSEKTKMTSFDRRKEAFETEFAHHEERAFKARARALWVRGAFNVQDGNSASII